MYGEKGLVLYAKTFERGSPPRVRGKATAIGKIIDAFRITPACAGKSFISRQIEKSVKDHPRVCGEKNYVGGYVSGVSGSPPRVRGKGCAG